MRLSRVWFSAILIVAAVSAAVLTVSQIVLAGPLPMSLMTSAPAVVSYQGAVKVDNRPYTGDAYFKIAIVNANGSKTYWSNDGTSAAGSAPSAAVKLVVSNGVFNVLLGDTTLGGMTEPLTPAVFRRPDGYLRTWFSRVEAGPYQHLLPDRRIAAAPYALNAETVDGLDAAELAPLNRPAIPAAADLKIVDQAGDVGQYTAITVGRDALPVIAYYDVDNKNLKLAHCEDTACSSAKIVVLDGSEDDVGKFAAIAIGADGLPVVSYYDASAGDLKVAHCGEVDCSAGNALTVVDSDGDVGQYTSIAIGRDGLPVISYYAVSSDDLKVVHCGNMACSSDNTFTTPDSRSGMHTVIVVGVDGLPVISYSVPIDPLKVTVIHCGDIYCSSGNQISNVGYPDSGAAYTSMTVGADGFPLITYATTALSDGYILSVHCRNLICSSAPLSSIESSISTVYQQSSMSIGPNGFPWLSFYDPANGNLKFSHCTDIAPCSVWTTNVVDDSANDVGSYASLTTGADGLPIISYYDATVGDLKVAHCTNPFCAPYFRRR